MSVCLRDEPEVRIPDLVYGEEVCTCKKYIKYV